VKIGEPAWIVVVISAASTAGAACRKEWTLAIVFGVITIAFALVSLVASRRRGRPGWRR
jgi:hypothetical protein